MRCIQFHSALLPSHPRLKHKQLVWLSTVSTNVPLKLPSQNHLSLGTSCKIMHSHNAIVLEVTSPAKSGDISVLLQVGGVLLIAYVFSNFVVPNLISEYFGFNKSSEDEEDEDLI